MDNPPRELLLNYIRKNESVCVIDEYVEHIKKYILSSLIENIFYVIIDYIKKTRDESDYKMGKLEIEYYYTDEFHESDDPRKYLDMNREIEDIGLIMYVYDNFTRMELNSNRRMMFYLMNMTYFDL